MIFSSISILIILCYAVLIAAISFGWWRLKGFNKTLKSPEVKISIVVAARNEASNIENLLEILLRQDYPSDLFEIIIVDDQSDDHTARLVEEMIARNAGIQNLKLVSPGVKDGSGKKAAIGQGIKVSGGELIVITDADCTPVVSWISALAAYYSVYKPQMILGPVRMTAGGSFFGKLQSLEFTSLISSAAGSCNAGFPLLANGANIAFTRNAYETCGGFTGNIQYSSGDDMFMMLSIKKNFGASAIRFLRSEKAIVDTPSTQGFKPFIHQRIRWVSKSRGYSDPLLIAASLLVFMVNTWLIVTAFSAIVFSGFLNLFLVFYAGKLIIDLPLVISYNRFQKTSALIWLFPLMELLNALYTLIIGIAGNTGRYEWKGRKATSAFIQTR